MSTSSKQKSPVDRSKNQIPPQPSKPHIPIVHKVAESALLREFREFINRGNMVDLAIGIAVGGAFTSIVNSFVNDIIMPIASLTVGGLDFTTLAIDIPNLFGADTTAHIALGNFLQNIVNFLSIAFVIFLFVRLINGMNRAKEAADEKAKAEATKAKAKYHAEKQKYDEEKAAYDKAKAKSQTSSPESASHPSAKSPKEA